MKKIKLSSEPRISAAFLLILLLFIRANSMAQEVTDSTLISQVKKPVRNTFESAWLIDNQSVMVPIKGTLEMDIMHRFGTIDKGYNDFFGIYAPSNIRIGFSYAPINKLNIGFGFTKTRMTWDFNIKYSVLNQTKPGGPPVSITYFGNIATDTRPKNNFVNGTDRLSYFHQIIIARKVTNKLSVQVSPSLTHFNAVEGYINNDGEIEGKMLNDHIAISVGGRYRITDVMNLMVNYDQPITKHKTNNPDPNIAFGLEFITSGHAFQIFFSNYQNIIPQLNNMYNQNDYKEQQFLIGFNITRLWNF